MSYQFLKRICFLFASFGPTAIIADQFVSIRPGAVRSTIGDGSMLGLNFEVLSDSNFGLVSELNYRDSKAEGYSRNDIQAMVGADMKFSPYISVVSSLVFQSSQSQIENEYSLINSKTHTIGLANGLSSRWVFGKNFYAAIDWVSIFTPLNTVQSNFSLTEKLRVYASEQRRIERSFFRAEVMGNGTFLSPRIGWKF
jgi:hypothetical protein